MRSARSLARRLAGACPAQQILSLLGTSGDACACIADVECAPRWLRVGARALGTTAKLDALPKCVAPPQRQPTPSARTMRERRHAAAVLRACCTVAELQERLQALPAAVRSSPDVLVRAAVRAPHLVQWPLTPPDAAALHQLFASITSLCAMHLELFDLSGLAAVLGACARAHVVPEELVLPLQLRLAADARLGLLKEAASDVSEVATHVSRMRMSAPRLWVALGEAALACLDHAAPAHAASLAAAHARAGVAEPRVYAAAAARLASEMASAHPQDVATILWALARSDSACPRALARAVAGHLADNRYSLLLVASIAGSVHKLALQDAGLHGLLCQRGIEALYEERRAHASGAFLFQQHQHQHHKSHQADAVTVASHAAALVAAVRRLGVRCDELPRAAAALIRALGERAPAASRAYIAEYADAVLAAAEASGLQDVTEMLSEELASWRQQVDGDGSTTGGRKA